MKKKGRIRILVLLAAVLIAYADTLILHYTLDDRLVIFQNDFTLQGLDGAGDVITQDGFAGYFGKGSNLVAGGRYRPLAQLTFILEYELFGKGIRSETGFNRAPQNEDLFLQTPLPLVGHLGNLIFYLLLTLVVYIVLKKLFPSYDNAKWYLSLPFLAALFFALHPIHTEAVANIKGRDEILSMLGGMLTLWMVIEYISTRKIHYLFLSFFTFILGIFAKENAITFLAVIPLALYYLPQSKKRKDWIVTLIPSFTAAGLFLLARYYALGSFMPPDTSGTILNNPYLYSTFAEKTATVILTWGIYLKLLLFPHPLTHDYYPHQITITNFSNPVVILLLLFFLFVIVYAFLKLKSKSILSFGILFFIITFSIVSNLLFNIGTFMNERFLFVPLLGYTLILAYAITLLAKLQVPRILVPALCSVILGLYTFKTITRNLDWKDDFTLFTHDVKISSNSIKCNVSAGGSYMKRYSAHHREADFIEGEKCLLKALSLDPYSFFANELLGNLYFHKNDYKKSYYYFVKAASLDTQNSVARDNVDLVRGLLENEKIKEAEALLDAGKTAKALETINIFIEKNPGNAAAYNIKGKILGMGMNAIDSSIIYLGKAIEIDSTFTSALENMGVALAIKRKFDLSLSYLLRAHALSPENQSVIQNIILVYQNAGDRESAEEWRKKVE